MYWDEGREQEEGGNEKAYSNSKYAVVEDATRPVRIRKRSLWPQAFFLNKDCLGFFAEFEFVIATLIAESRAFVRINDPTG